MKKTAHWSMLTMLLACGTADPIPDGGRSDGNVPGPSLSDGGASDAASSLDADLGDGGIVDAGTDDGGALDAQLPDAGPREPSAEVQRWAERFDEEWERSLAFYTEQSQGPETGGQRRYYDFRVIDGLIHMLQATGDTRYLDNLIWYVDRLKDIAIESDDGYFDWPVNGVNTQLYDGHGLRNIFKVLLILKRNPALREMANYQEKYDEYLPWFRENIWNKWVSRGCRTIFRSRTHMASHMASNMALYLSLLSDDESESEVFLSYVNAFNDDIHALCPSAAPEGVGMRDQLRIDTRHGGYVWNSRWGTNTGSNDITHANAEVQAIINQHIHGRGEWSNDDIDRLSDTINAILDASPDDDYSNIPYDLFAIFDSSQDNRPFIHYGFAMLGQFDSDLHDRLANINPRQFRSSRLYNQFLGTMAINQAKLDGYVPYPER